MLQQLLIFCQKYFDLFEAETLIILVQKYYVYCKSKRAIKIRAAERHFLEAEYEEDAASNAISSSFLLLL